MASDWPVFSYDDWRETCDTLHAHTQVLGKLAVALAPPEPQLQHGALRVTARGWETLPLPAPNGSGSFVALLDLHAHEAAIEHRGGPADPPSDDFIMRNAMDAQEVALGWWPGDARYGKAAFYAYAHPAPEGFADARLSPPSARWDADLGEYVLDWEDVCAGLDPHA